MISKVIVYRGEFYIYFHSKGKTFRQKSGVKIKKKDIKSVKSTLRSGGFPKLYLEYRPLITSIQSNVENIISNYIIKHNRKPTPIEIQNILDQGETSNSLVDFAKILVEEKREKFEDEVYSMASLKDYTSLLNSLIDFETENSRVISISSLDDFGIEYFQFLRKKRPTSTSKKFITKGGLKGKTIRKRLDSFNELVRMIEKKEQNIDSKKINEKVNDLYNSLSRKLIQSKVKYALDEEGVNELRKLIQDDKERSKVGQFSLEMFLVSCLTGMRFSDVSIIERDDIDYEEKIISMTSSKSSIDFEVKLSKEVEHILEKYDYQMNKYANGVVNKNLKLELSASRYFKKEIKINKKKYIRYKVISFHTGRRTFISRLLNEFKIAPSRVMKMSGHTQISTLNDYIIPDKKLFDTDLL